MWREITFLQMVDSWSSAELSGDQVKKIDNEPFGSDLWKFADKRGETYLFGNGDTIYICSDGLDCDGEFQYEPPLIFLRENTKGSYERNE
jgi:hypothetical protein